MSAKTGQSIWDTITEAFVPVHRDGHKFIALGAVVTLLLFLIWAPLGWLAALATAAIAYFFRDPDRMIPLGDTLVLAPADGRLVALRERRPPAELDLGDAPRLMASTFLSIFDVHIIRAPVGGQIIRSRHESGGYLNAALDEASQTNERQALTIRTQDGSEIGVVLVAGLVARRIVPLVEEGDFVSAGERIGLIRFGSRVDVYAPLGGALRVAEGQQMTAGETVLLDRAAEAAPFEARRD